MSGPKVLIATSMGDITMQLDTVHAPLTVREFPALCPRAAISTAPCIYRVVPGFVIQAGSLDADVKSARVHDPIPLESAGLKNLRGTIAIAMARADDPVSATAEFFINLADNPALDRQSDVTPHDRLCGVRQRHRRHGRGRQDRRRAASAIAGR